jgi:hypothetical protein
MSDLVEFLRARLADDEEIALAALPGPWSSNAEQDEVVCGDGITVCEGFALSNRQLRATVKHIAHQDPARTLREVEAKRKILDQYLGWPVPTLCLLALPYADHPDFDEAWRPA